MTPHRRTLVTAFIVALLSTAIGQALLPLGLRGFARGSIFTGIALNLWAVLLIPSIVLSSVLFSFEFLESRFLLVTGLGFVFNVVTWTLVLYGINRLVNRIRKNNEGVPVSPA